MDQQLINRIVEAALLASSQPLGVAQLAALFTLDEPAPEGSIQAALAALQAESEGRGIELVEVASGWRYQVRADVHAWVARLWTERQAKYTRATLETLALIAYRQPITRGEIEQVRGVATSSNIIKALEEREWIRVVGHRDMPGRPELLGTTRAFLDYFGLKRLDELPPLSELKDFGELEPQLEFGGDRAVGGIAGPDGTQDGDAADHAANDAEPADAGTVSEGSDVGNDNSDRDDDAAGEAPRPGHPSSDGTDDAVDAPQADEPMDADGMAGTGDAEAGTASDTTPADDGPAHANDPTAAGDTAPPDDDATSRDDALDNGHGRDSHPRADGDDAAAAQQDALADDGDSIRSRHE